MPSAKVLESKKQIVADMIEKLKTAQAGVLVDYCGLTVEEDTDLRNKLRAAGVEYKVVKNTLTRFAAKEVGFDELDAVLNGPTSLAVSYDDPVAPAKVIADFAKDSVKASARRSPAYQTRSAKTNAIRHQKQYGARIRSHRRTLSAHLYQYQ